MRKRNLVTDAEFVSEDRRLGGVVGAGTLARPISFTAKQGQYLAFIYYYSKIHGRAQAEADFERFFRVTPPEEQYQTMRDAGAFEENAVAGAADAILFERARDFLLGEGPTASGNIPE